MKQYKVIALSCFCIVDGNTYNAGDMLPDGLHETDAKDLVSRGFIELVEAPKAENTKPEAKGK